MPQSRLSVDTVQKSGVEESPGLSGDFDEDLEDEFEPPPIFCIMPHNLLSGEDGPPAALDLDLVIPDSNSRQGALHSKGKRGEKRLFLPDGEDKQLEMSTSNNPTGGSHRRTTEG